MARIAIIGAGVTGSYLAHTLVNAGHAVTVLEKSRGRGGRCASKRLDWGQFDIGAPFIRTNDNTSVDVLDALTQTGVAQRWSVAPCEFHGREHDNSLLPQQTDDRFYVFTPGMNGACRFWLQNSTLVTSVRITRLQKTAKGWLLWDQQQSRHGVFDWVLLTAPWPQTQPLLLEHADTVLPSAEHHWLSCRAVAVQCDVQRSDKAPIIYLRDSPLQLLVRDSSKPARSEEKGQIWVAHFAHQVSAQELYPEDDRHLQRVCQQMGAVFQQTRVIPTHSYQHTWRYARLSHQGALPGIILEPASALAAAGDWSFGGSVPAAIKAGQSLYSQLSRLL